VDAGYGNDSKLRAGITELGKRYVVASAADAGMEAGQAAEPAPKKGQRDAPDTVSVKDPRPRTAGESLAHHPMAEGSNEWLSSRFARVRVHVASGHERPSEPTKEWGLIEWPEGEKEPTKYWLSTLPSNIAFRDLVDAASCAGASSATIKSSSKRSGSGIMKDADGAASIITPRCASQPMVPGLERETIPPSGPRPAKRFSQFAVSRTLSTRGSPVAP